MANSEHYLNPMSPEEQTQMWWLAMEATHLRGGVLLDNTPDIDMHPNEVAALDQVKHVIATEGQAAGVKRAQEMGLDLRHLPG